ncbi:MAG: PEP-CTERM sorting domain-containing protein [Pseudomonadota bacterium]
MNKALLGSLVGLALGIAPAAYAATSVAVISGGTNSATGAAAQLNDDTYHDFTATVISVSDAESLTTLQGYDAIVIGDSGFRNNGWTAAMFASLRSYFDGGGGIVSAGWYSYGTDILSGQAAIDAEYITPIDDGPYNFATSGTLGITDVNPITADVSNFSITSCCFETAPLGVDVGATAFATINGQVAGAYQDTNGRSVYLGPIYMAAASNSSYVATVASLRSGEGDQLFEQAVFWAADGSVAPPVPLPSSFTFALAGIAGLGWAARRKRKTA